MIGKKAALLIMVEPLGGADVRLFFSDGIVIERALPGVKSALKVRIVDEGLGIDPGDDKGDMSAWMLYNRRGGRRYQFGGATPPTSRNPRARSTR